MKEILLQENPIRSDWIVVMKPWLNSVKVLKGSTAGIKNALKKRMPSDRY